MWILTEIGCLRNYNSKPKHPQDPKVWRSDLQFFFNNFYFYFRDQIMVTYSYQDPACDLYMRFDAFKIKKKLI